MVDRGGNSLRSVRRCFAIMELFDRERRPMSASEIARELSAPLSSVIDLLRCMSELGYLSLDSRGKSYCMTTRIGGLGAWMNDAAELVLDHTDFMEKLHQETQETIAVFWQNGFDVTCVSQLAGRHPLTFNLEEGSQLPLFGSAVGWALLSTWDDADIQKFYRRAKAQKIGDLPKEDALFENVNRARRDGYAAGYDLVIPSVGAIAGPVPAASGQWAVLSIGGLSSRVRQSEAKYAAALVKYTARFSRAFHNASAAPAD